ncbi:pyruvate dehydrogenase complex dihydrolipoamide acetyltransferase [Solitalea canadensis]|uniref:Acetyltransferase component of pyruvate dehydrogenase complex n=1 Tax=Solitalea canadensis (strain ATCC 29591 / DSM 3403 / JCM 21819 / LMG 8368 / NBRC 15130 / NCIMB 12057 / USAM 9D) TaxID=929556 RepID=H8KLQ5_SOLCM|nr:pyruvate dehydrogenase complex dihydrolipoamide acetyltransferase [Solitalea canadensis]AFD09209.1 pyruvate dehydrogenase complex dihydrolipoamide acetyltransferase, long form [Solitalea canadensis DSM 3403]
MAEVVRMPKMSDTMTEGVLAKWHKKVGDKVKSGDVVAEVETDKATMDFESFQEGTLLYIGVEEGQAVPVDAVIAVLGAEGEDYKAALAAEGGNGKAAAAPAEAKAEAAPAPVQSSAPAVTPESLGATVIRMPLLSDTMTEGVINKWYKKIGDTIKSDDTIADVETDKATMEVTAYAEGTLLYIGVEEGKAAKVNDIIAIVGKPGTDVSPLLQAAPAAAPAKEEASAGSTAASATSAPVAEASTADANGRVKASPLARKIAEEKGIDLAQVKGSAEGGRIVKKDVETFTPSAAPTAKAATPGAGATTVAAPAVYGQESFTEVAVTQMRKTIARRLSESLFTAPHFYLTMSIDMDQAMEARKRINELGTIKISFNDIVLKAVAVALKKHPKVNSSWLGDKIRYNNHVNIGVAVAVEDGLLVPVVRFADTKSLSTISTEVKEYAQKAKDKKLQPADWEGSTFTISNLGMYGIDQFTAIINPPDACILAVGGISQVPVVKNGQVVPGNVMKVTLSCDHRVVDGATGSEFLQTLKGLLEEPLRLLV